MALIFRDRMASGRRKDAALDLMMRARGILNVDDDAVVSVSEDEATPSETGADEPHG
jgi:hypothetical protein